MTVRTVRRTFSVLLAAAVGLAVAVTVAPGTASAAVLDVAYDASGTSTIAKTGSTVALGPAVLTVGIEADDFDRGIERFDQYR